jgi:hypothetical protein
LVEAAHQEQYICNGLAFASLMIIRRLQWAHTLVCSQRVCNGHAVASMMMIRRLQLAHTLVCAQRILQQPCRGFSGDNSRLTVGTHVGVFPRIGNVHAVASLLMIRSLQEAHPSVCAQRICQGHAVASLMINRSSRWTHTFVCSHRICNGRAVASLMIIRRLQWAHPLVFSQRLLWPCRCFSDDN